MTNVEFADALDAVNTANNVVQGNESLFRNISQTVIAAVVVGIWGFAIVAMVFWTLNSGEGSGSFVCNTPPVSGTELGTDCTNAWVATRDQLKDVFTFGVLPFLTLVVGFFFGQKSSVPAA